ncbi:MAG: hypothetical protein DMF61_07345 [Blastocatellia bacterium AA13]|nr:MAG: hypothetical protein DMF61_07345 [Blastocatellia bacterium AA13]
MLRAAVMNLNRNKSSRCDSHALPLCVRAAGAAVGCLVLFVSALAQTNTAQLMATVKDAGGAVLPNASVTLVHAASGVKFERISNESGAVFFPSLPVGEYTISIERDGFKRLVRSGIVLQLGQTVNLDFTLEVGAVTDQVTITGSEALLQSTTAEISDVIDKEKVIALPLNGRQFLQLALLSEGVIKPPGGTRGAALQQAGDLVNVGGQRSGHNIYLLDGVKVTDEYLNNLVISPSVEAIREFKIQKSMYSPEFGGKASALINVATKAGTNAFHGSLFEFFRNEVLDAKNFFDNPNKPIPPFRQNQFGFAGGGPILIPRIYDGRNKSFFFVNYEGQRSSRSVTKTFSAPSAAARLGDFSHSSTIYDPSRVDSSGRRLPFSGNIIPAGQLDPVALAILAKVPLPNLPGEVQNLVSAVGETNDVDQFNLRFDGQLTPRDSVFARLSIYNAQSFQPFGTSQLNESLIPGFGRQVATSTSNIALSHTRIISANLLNEVRFGWLGVSGGQLSENAGSDFASRAGLQGVTNDPRDSGFPQISFAGLYSAIGDPTTFVSRRDSDFELFDNVLLRRGNHTMKFGAYWFHFAFRPSNPDTARGSFAFTNKWTSSAVGAVDGNAFADFLLGYPTTAQVGLGRGEEDGRTNWLHFYAQDDWSVTRNLTINAGLRFELNQQMVDVNNGLSAIDLSVPGGRIVIASDDHGNISPTAAPLLPLLPLPYVTSEAAGWDRSLLRLNYNRFAPRLGLAWKLPGKSETVVRAGFGVFLNQWAYSVQQALARNLPFFIVKSINTAADARNPAFTTENILTSNALGTVGGNNMDHDYRIEYNEAWTLSIQGLLTTNTLIEVSYIGSRTIGADSSTVRNVPLPGPGPINQRRPIPVLSGFNTIRWDGWSAYNALTFKIERRLARGVSFAANYTWSKSIDDASDPGATTFETNLPQNVRDLPSERALSSFDHRHRFVGTFSYDLPFGSGATGARAALLKGWQVSGIATVQSGAPFTVNLGVDRANIGAGPAQRPNLLRDPNLSSGKSPEAWFDTSAFSLPDQFSFGNAGRNIVFAPGFTNMDLSLQKETRLHEALKLKLRAEVFNVFNHPNFDVPNRIAFTPSFGRISSAEPSRQIQLALKLEF